MSNRQPRKRGKADHLTLADIKVLLAWFLDKRGPTVAARDVNCSRRIATKYFAMFRSGWRPGEEVIRCEPGSDRIYYGPVPHRPVPPPNAMPWATTARLMGRRA